MERITATSFAILPLSLHRRVLRPTRWRGTTGPADGDPRARRKLGTNYAAVGRELARTSPAATSESVPSAGARRRRMLRPSGPRPRQAAVRTDFLFRAVVPLGERLQNPGRWRRTHHHRPCRRPKQRPRPRPPRRTTAAGAAPQRKPATIVRTLASAASMSWSYRARLRRAAILDNQRGVSSGRTTQSHLMHLITWTKKSTPHDGGRLAHCRRESA
jgi:hypothetical protein